MPDGFEKVRRAVAAGELDGWKGSLLASWLRSERALAGAEPTPFELANLLLDADLLAKLKAEAPEGPWEILAAQARSMAAHDQMGDALQGVSDQP